MNDDRIPPHDLDAEEAVLGSLLIDDTAILKVADLLKPENFYRDKNQWVYAACSALYERNDAINQITVAHELGRRDKLDAVGGPAYLSNLVQNVPTAVHVEHYGKIVQRLSVMRSLIAAAGQIADIGYEAPPEIDLALERADNLLFQLRHGRKSREFVHIRTILDSYFEETSFAAHADEEGFLPHINTSFTLLDKKLTGLHRSDMIILAARPSMGKTSLAINIARNAAINQKARVAIFSLEMSKLELAYRFISAESGISNQLLRTDQLTELQRDRVMRSLETIAEAPIYIDDSAFLRDSDMRSKARRLKNEAGIDLIIIDYIQLMRSGRRTDNRVQEMTYISQSVKELARDINVPVLAVSQLSRAVETRTPHTPMLSDLRESGSIEQDADVVLFIYREDVYHTEEEWARLNPDRPYPKGEADVIIAKHRNGPTGVVKLHFNERITKFENAEVVAEKPSLL
ncbi:MAG: replicative DNA helicase [Dehalococcoidia bacterium]|nr:replicative DNA helicase [Dehalococcoidia bacterium]